MRSVNFRFFKYTFLIIIILSSLNNACKKKAKNRDIKRVDPDKAGYFDLAVDNACSQETINQASLNYLWSNYKDLDGQDFNSLAELTAYYQGFIFKPGENKIEICALDGSQCSDLISITVVGDKIVAYRPEKAKECEPYSYWNYGTRHKYSMEGVNSLSQLGDKSESLSEAQRFKQNIYGYGEFDLKNCDSEEDCLDYIPVATLPDRFSGDFNIRPKECELFTYPNTSSPQYLVIYDNRSFRVGDGSDDSININGIRQTVNGSGAKMCRVAPLEVPVENDSPPAGLVNIELIEKRVNLFHEKVCQDSEDCPQGRRLMQLYDFETLKNHPKTGISEILNPFAAPKDKFAYQCIINSSQDIWSGYGEISSSQYQNHSSSCHRVVNQNNQVKLNLTRPRSSSLFDRDKYQFEIDNSKYSEHQDLINLEYIRIETQGADTIAASRVKVLSSQSAPFPSSSLTGNYFILNVENFTTGEFRQYNNEKSEDLRKGLIPAKSYLIIKEQFIQDWLDEVRSFLNAQAGKTKPNPTAWCALANNLNKCVQIDQDLINLWQVERKYVYSGIGFTNVKTLTPENSFKSIKLARVVMDVLDKGGTGNQKLLLINDCAYKPNRLREYYRAFYDDTHSFYRDLNTFLENRVSLNARKRQNEVFGRISCDYNDTYIRYISNFHRQIDQNEQRKEAIAAWVHAAETLLAFEAVALLPELELPLFVTYAMNYISGIMGVAFIGQLFNDFNKLEKCKKDSTRSCFLEKNEIWIDAAFIAIPFSKKSVGKLVNYYDLFKDSFFEGEAEYFEEEKEFSKSDENKGSCVANGLNLTACTGPSWEQTMIEHGKSILKYLKDNPEASAMQNPKDYIQTLFVQANRDGGDIINTLLARDSSIEVILPEAESNEATRLKYISVISAVQWSLADLRIDKFPFVESEYIRGPGTVHGEEYLGKLYLHYFAFENQLNLDFSKNLNELVLEIKSMNQVFGRLWNPFVYNRTGSAFGFLPLSSHLKQKNLNSVFLIGIDMKFSKNQTSLAVLPAGDRHIHVGLFQFVSGGQTVTYFKEEPWGLGTRKEARQHFKDWGKHIFADNANKGPRETNTPREKIEDLFQSLKEEGYENNTVENKIPSLNSGKGAIYSFLEEVYQSFRTYPEEKKLIFEDIFEDYFDTVFVIGNEYTISAEKMDSYLAPNVVDP